MTESYEAPRRWVSLISPAVPEALPVGERPTVEEIATMSAEGLSSLNLDVLSDAELDVVAARMSSLGMGARVNERLDAIEQAIGAVGA